MDHSEIDIFDLTSLDTDALDRKKATESSSPAKVHQTPNPEEFFHPTGGVTTEESKDLNTIPSVPPNADSKPKPNDVGSDVDATLSMNENSKSIHKGESDKGSDNEEDDSDSDLNDFLLKLPVPPSDLPSPDDDDDNSSENVEGEGELKREGEGGSESTELDSKAELEAMDKLLDAKASLTLDNLPIGEPQTPEKGQDQSLDSSDPVSPWSVKFPPVPSQAPHLDHTHPGAYIEQASRLITKAIELESLKDYHDAFELYKAGVDLLLNGVKGMFMWEI